MAKNLEGQEQQGGRSSLVGELYRVRQKLVDNDRLFNMVCEEHLVEYAIYEHNALMAQYSHLLAMAKREQTAVELCR